jgi:hypothetical protein
VKRVERLIERVGGEEPFRPNVSPFEADIFAPRRTNGRRRPT